MKKLIQVTFIVSFFSSTAFGQSFGEKLEFGLGITPCVTWINPSTKMIKSGGLSLAFGFGARVYYQLSKKYALGFEVNLQNITAKTSFNQIDIKSEKITQTLSSDFKMNYHLRYLEIPILLKMKTDPSNHISYFGEFGGNFGLLLNQLADVRSTELNLDEVNTKSPEDGDMFVLKNPDSGSEYDIKINTLKAGLIFGSGIHYNLSNGSRAEIGIRYTLGLSDLYNESKWQASNHCLGLNLGFIF
jgi:hypothetical protein